MNAQVEIQNNQHDNQLKGWVLRALITLKGHKKFVTDASFSDDQLAEFLGLDRWLKIDIEFDRQLILRDLKTSFKLLEKEAIAPSIPLNINVELLSELLGLTVTEKNLVAFLIALHNEAPLKEAIETLGLVNSSQLPLYLSFLIQDDITEVKQAISNNSLLIKSGLLTIDRFGPFELNSKISLFSNDFADQMYACVLNENDLLKMCAQRSSQATLLLDDFTNIKEQIILVEPYLKIIHQSAKPGVNILLYGSPGTGKTEFSKTIAELTGYDLFEVISSDADDGDPLSGDQRLRAYCVAQSLLSCGKNLLVFDEVEDVFGGSQELFSYRPSARRSKAWFNRLLENNQVPAIWITNNIDAIDPAFIRRFDFAIEFGNPSISQRKKVLDQYCQDFLSCESRQKLSHLKDLSPAGVARAAKVVDILKKSSFDENELAFRTLVNDSLKAQGYKSIKSNFSDASNPEFSTQYIQSSYDIDLLVQGILRTKTGRICLYGPPGTGKSAFGHWLSKIAELPLSIKKVSDLISPYVGESEKNIAACFEEASQDNAILMIDEADSFLRDRRQASQSWEVTLVNEMLTQIEHFDGLLIVSTNLLNGLDQASLRRFDLKIQFDFLDAEKSWALFKGYCSHLKLKKGGRSAKTKLATINNLTPGDFASVARRSRLLPLDTADEFLSALIQEVSYKESKNLRIGFIH